jgi:LysM repeat protein
VYDDLPTDQPSSVSPDPGDRAAPAWTETARSQLPGMDRSTTERVCPFLRAAAPDGEALGQPIEAPDPANRCVALHEPVPQSLRQQELVCLSSAHVNCPLYVRGSVGVAAPVEQVAATRTVTPATAAALALFGLAFVVSVGFVVATGGLTLTAAVATPTPAGAVLGEVETAAPAVEPTADPTPSPTPTASPSPSPSPTPTPTPNPTPHATPKATQKPTSGRYALLKPCPGTPDCYIYVVRSGDNLFSIAKYFGVPLKTVEAMNPWTKNGLVAGRDLRIPTPTR